MAPTTFEFVVQQGDKGFSKVTQTKIRRQAMKAVAASRRQTGQYAKQNRRQHEISYPTPESSVASLSSPDSSRSSGSDLSPRAVPIGDFDNTDERVVTRRGKRRFNPPEDSEYGLGDKQYPNQETAYPDPDQAVMAALNKLRSTMFRSGLEDFLMDYSIDVADLSALTTIHIAGVASAVFTSEPSRLRDLLACRYPSYFQFLYSRYGHSQCLDDAVRCLIIVCQDLLAPSPKTSRNIILSHYGKALKSLQKAINDPNEWASADTLCATGMLQLFTALYPAACTSQTWSQHLAGSLRMVQLKGPHEFNTPYEKALLKSVAAAATTEAFLQNTPCFLEEPIWQAAMLSCKVDTELFSDRSPIAIDMALLIVRLPGVCQRVGDVVCGEDPAPEAVDAARKEVHDLRREIRLWRNRFDAELILDLPSTAVPAGDKYKRLDALANAIIFEVILARLIGSVEPAERFLMEDEIQEGCAYIAKIEETCRSQDYRTSFYISQKAVISFSLLETSPLWMAPHLEGELIEPWKFRQWCDALPRRSP